MSGFIVTNREIIDRACVIDREDLIDLLVQHTREHRELLCEMENRDLGIELERLLDSNHDLAYEVQQLLDSSHSMEDEWTVEVEGSPHAKN